MSEPRQTESRAAVVERRPWREWLARYGGAEIVGTAGALLGAYLVHAITGSEIAAAYGGTLGENLGFYGVIIGREVRADSRRHRGDGRAYGARQWLVTASNLVLEFGFAEILDSLLIRPLAMAAGTHFLGRGLGVPAGKVVADVVFYIPVITSFELRRRTQRASTES
jgi:hypothetical protein